MNFTSGNNLGNKIGNKILRLTKSKEKIDPGNKIQKWRKFLLPDLLPVNYLTFS